MSDLIERLRADEWASNATLRREAADEIERLRASLNNDMFEKMADEIDSLETQIERLRDALYEIAHMDPIRRIQGDAQRVAKKALENKE